MRKATVLINWERTSYFSEEIELDIPTSVPIGQEEQWARERAQQDCSNHLWVRKHEPSKYEWFDDELDVYPSSIDVIGKDPLAPTPGQIDIFGAEV